MSTHIGFNLNANRQIEHFQKIKNEYSLSPEITAGRFFFQQAELALKGAYVPKEEIYIMAYDGPSDSPDIERYIRNMIRNGSLSGESLFHFSLRDVAFVYEKISPYSSHSVGNLWQTLQKASDDPRMKKQLNAYRMFHQEREKDLYNRVINAISTGQGVLLFNDASRGIQYAQKYLQHIADNFFSPVYRDTDKLRIHYFSTSNVNLIKEAQKCSGMFEKDTGKKFLPAKARFLVSGIIANYPPSVECDMAPTLECYKLLTDKLNLKSNTQNYNIGMLDRICRSGKTEGLEDDHRFDHRNSFLSIDERIQKSYVGRQDGTLLKNSLERTIRDTARRILETQYEVRGYAPSVQEKKKSRSVKI